MTTNIEEIENLLKVSLELLKDVEESDYNQFLILLEKSDLKMDSEIQENGFVKFTLGKRNIDNSNFSEIQYTDENGKEKPLTFKFYFFDFLNIILTNDILRNFSGQHKETMRKALCYNFEKILERYGQNQKSIVQSADDENLETYMTDDVIAKKLDIHRVTLWRWVREGKFPKPVKLTNGSTRWEKSVVLSWQKTRKT